MSRSKEFVALSAFLSAAKTQGMDGMRMREAMKELINEGVKKPRRKYGNGRIDSPINIQPWPFINGVFK
jgi:hypothetical protein